MKFQFRNNLPGFEILDKQLGRDVKASIQTALAEGAVFKGVSKPISIFHQALETAICDIESHPRGDLFQEFLRKGPYENTGAIPSNLYKHRLSDEQTASVITFVYSHMVNCFKGAVAELLAAVPCCRILKRLKSEGLLAENAKLYVGDVVGVHRPNHKGILKGADLHILIEESHRYVTVAGVAEVKSYFKSAKSLTKQLNGHVSRTRNGLLLGNVDYSPKQVRIGYGKKSQIVRITVLPDNWKLPRSFRFEPTGNNRLLLVDPGFPQKQENLIIRIRDDDWQITLKWSKEALAAAAYEMTFWYMRKIGEVIYSNGVPEEWAEMTPAEAGSNAAKMMLYYSILRCRTERESQRAIALYNSYGFGYALGMNFKNAAGKREMLWPEDLDEILSSGCTKHGCRLD